MGCGEFWISERDGMGQSGVDSGGCVKPILGLILYNDNF